MENAVVYARYSSHSQTEQSIEGQLAAARRYAIEHDYNIIHEYCDRARTGTNDNREEFQHMLKDTAKHQFTVIIVWKVDRFGRNREELLFNKYKCKKNGVRVEYVAESISSGPEGVIMEALFEGMAEYYSLQLSQNVSRGYLESAKKHHVIGLPPIGYKKAQDKTYEIAEDEAEIVRLVFKKFIGGMSQYQIIQYLNSKGYKNKQGKPFKKNAIQRMLIDERYIGVYKFKDIIREEGVIPPIVDTSTFMQAQEALKIHKRKCRDNWDYSEYMLSEKVYCSACQHKMKGSSGYGKKGTKYKYYICPTCKKIHVRSDIVDTRVIEILRKYLDDNKILDDIADAVYEYYKKDDLMAKEVSRLEKERVRIETAIQNLVNSIEKGMDYDLIEPRLDELKAEKANIMAQLNDLKLSAPIKLTKEMIYVFLVKMKNESVDSRLIEQFIDTIIVYNDHLNIILNYTKSGKQQSCSTDIEIMGTIDRWSNNSTLSFSVEHPHFEVFEGKLIVSIQIKK